MPSNVTRVFLALYFKQKPANLNVSILFKYIGIMKTYGILRQTYLDMPMTIAVRASNSKQFLSLISRQPLVNYTQHVQGASSFGWLGLSHLP